MQGKVQIKVRGFHLDIFQHVNNARYLEFLEEGRWAFFDEFNIGDDLLKQGIIWAIVNINIDFKAEASFGDVLEIDTQFTKLGNRSITMKQRIVNIANDKLVVEADVTYVCFSKEHNGAIPLPDDYRKKIAQAIG
ncbi:acyl-CoA thioesterase [Marinomonas posidonica]|uniref:4-hydroxybenzoyl-CoA thioesterase n=1 Tax=Marinomonas posidonica (strain CECT 7376 / NCIMB 14433 / IVIA-Po-181) TaxID=491952 RepID=F6CU95_MARPP|nr:thioesterase family protein [Marinomonas posidonica]AEF55214.1 4-hydroxybenzoyl-CoA thioesterase [Marinomonas posidonica IVIA-Po-181]